MSPSRFPCLQGLRQVGLIVHIYVAMLTWHEAYDELREESITENNEASENAEVLRICEQAMRE